MGLLDLIRRRARVDESDALRFDRRLFLLGAAVTSAGLVVPRASHILVRPLPPPVIDLVGIGDLCFASGGGGYRNGPYPISAMHERIGRPNDFPMKTTLMVPWREGTMATIGFARFVGYRDAYDNDRMCLIEDSRFPSGQINQVRSFMCGLRWPPTKELG